MLAVIWAMIIFVVALTIEMSIAKDFLRGFPTLKVFMHGVPTDCYGLREADMLVRVLKKFVAPDVAILESDGDISNFVEEAGTVFPMYLGFGMNESMMSKFAIKYKKRAWFAVVKGFSDNTMEFYDFDKVPALVSLHATYVERNIFYRSFDGCRAVPKIVCSNKVQGSCKA